MKKVEKVFLAVFFLAALSTGVETNARQPLTIVSFGDSTTAPRQGVVTYSDVLRSELAKKNPQVKVINSGVPGNTTEHAKARFEKDVMAHKPDLVIIRFGTNDAAVDVWKTPPAVSPRVSLDVYEKNLRGFVSAVKKQGGKVILVAPAPTRWTDKLREMYGKSPYNPNDPDGFNVILKNYAAAVRKIAAAEKVALVDLFAEYYKYDRAAGQKMDDLFLDGLHPNSLGQRIEAGLLLKRISAMNLGL